MVTFHSPNFANPRLALLAAAIALACPTLTSAVASAPGTDAAATSAWPDAVAAREFGPMIARGARRPLVITDGPRAPAAVFVSNCDDAGAGSLREAMAGAASGDSIDLSQLQCSRISLTTGAIVFAQDQLALVGPGRNRLTIDAGANTNVDGALIHLGFGTLIADGLTIANGTKYRTDTTALGGCIQSQGNVILRNAKLDHCTARGGPQVAALGGGIWAQGTVIVDRSIVTGCSAYTPGGYASGGGVYANDGFQAMSSLIENNSTESGGRPSFGGGVFAWGNTFITNTAVVHNTSARFAGLALYNRDGSSGVIVQSTIADNRATRVGGVFSRGPLTLNASTIAFNTASEQFDSQDHPSAAGLQMGPALLNFTSNLLAANHVVGVDAWSDLQGLQGVLMVGTFNLITGTLLPPPPDTIGFMPHFGPLLDNGGLTPTRLLYADSPGVDEGTDTTGGFTTDQRGTGFPRSLGGQTDMGAVEFDPDRIFTTGTDFASFVPTD